MGLGACLPGYLLKILVDEHILIFLIFVVLRNGMLKLQNEGSEAYPSLKNLHPLYRELLLVVRYIG